LSKYALCEADADRVIMIDEHAQIVDGDTILAICAKDMKERNALENNTVVSTIMSNLGFMKCMDSLGINVISAPVGDRYVVQEMLEHGATLGGEKSGHMIFLEHNTTGDGLVTALQVLRIMIETDSKLSDLAKLVTHFPQALVNAEVSKKPPLEELSEVQKEIKNIEQQLSGEGRIVVRYSGTENICRVMIEGKKQKEVQHLAESLAQVIQTETEKY